MLITAEDIEKSYKYLPKSAFNYSVNISKTSSFIYLETAKVACSTIKRTLQDIETKVLGNPPLPVSRNIHKKTDSPLLSPSDIGLSELCQMLASNEVFKFSFVRNPYTRVLSAYLDKIKGKTFEREKIVKRLGVSSDSDISFEVFLQCIRDTPIREMDHHWRPQAYQLLTEVIDYDFIGRFESLSSDLEQVLKKIYGKVGSADTSIKRDSPHSTQADARLKSFYTEKAQILVRKIYAADFQQFEYGLELPIEGKKLIDERYLEYFSKGKSLLDSGDVSGAIEHMNASIQLNPDYCWSHHCLGNALSWNQEQEAAVSSYRRAIELNPQLTAAYLHLGKLLKKMGRTEEAEEALSTSARLSNTLE